jgi:hypothetical protein
MIGRKLGSRPRPQSRGSDARNRWPIDEGEVGHEGTYGDGGFVRLVLATLRGRLASPFRSAIG